MAELVALHSEFFDEALKLLSGTHRLPGMVVVDLDFTQWPLANMGSLDMEHMSLVPEAVATLSALKKKGVTCAVCGRSDKPDASRDLLNSLEATSLFAIQRTYLDRAQQLDKLAEIQRETGLSFEDMLFFDDGMGNIQEIAELGMTCTMFSDALRVSDLERALSMFSRRAGRRGTFLHY